MSIFGKQVVVSRSKGLDTVLAASLERCKPFINMECSVLRRQDLLDPRDIITSFECTHLRCLHPRRPHSLFTIRYEVTAPNKTHPC